MSADDVAEYIDDRADWSIQPWQQQFLESWLSPSVIIGALSTARGGGKTALVEGIVAAAIDPAGPLYQGEQSQVFVSSPSIAQARGMLAGVSRLVGVKHTGRRAYGYDDAGWELRRSQSNLGLTHESGSSLTVLGSATRTAHGLRPSLWIMDEPAQYAGKGAAMWSAAKTALGKVPGSRILAIGTLPESVTHWFSKLILDGDESVCSMLFQADRHDPLNTWQQANPNIHLGLPDPRVVEAELRSAIRDPRDRAMFLALRCNLGLADHVPDADLFCQLDDWQALATRPNTAPDGPPLVVGVDLGQTVSLSSVVGIWPDGSSVVHSFIGGEIPLAQLEDRHGCTGLYSTAAELGELTVVEGLSTPPVSTVLDFVAKQWGKPRSIVADSYNKHLLADAAAQQNWSSLVTIRGRSYVPFAEDVDQLRSSIDTHEFVRPESLLLDYALGKATIRRSSGGYWQPIKQQGDDTFAALLLAWREFKVVSERPEREHTLVIGGEL